MRKFIIGGLLVAVGVAASQVRAALVLDLKSADYNATTGTWTDSSGNGDDATQVTAANRPTLVAGGAPNTTSPVVRFASGQYLTLNTGISSTAYTVLAFVRPGDATNNPKTMISGDAGSLQYRIGGDSANGDKQELIRRSQANLGIGTGVLSTSAFSNINLAVDGTGGTFRLNGAADGTTGGLVTTAAATIIGSAGNGANAPNEGYVGDIAELQVYNTVLTTAQIQTIEANYNTTYAPEPASLTLCAIGGMVLLGRRRRRPLPARRA